MPGEDFGLDLLDAAASLGALRVFVGVSLDERRWAGEVLEELVFVAALDCALRSFDYALERV